MSSGTSDVEATTSHRIAKESLDRLKTPRATAGPIYKGASEPSGSRTPPWLAGGLPSGESTPTEDGLFETGWM